MQVHDLPKKEDLGEDAYTQMVILIETQPKELFYYNRINKSFGVKWLFDE